MCVDSSNDIFVIMLTINILGIFVNNGTTSSDNNV